MTATEGVLALIPARGGSRGIPRKNLVRVAGRTLLEWAVHAGLGSGRVDRVVVSTDDPGIAEVAVAAGAEVPFVRPAELAGDLVDDLPVFAHALAWFSEHEGYRPDLVVHLRPTCPVRPPGLVDSAISMLSAHPEADSVRSVAPPPQSPYKMWTNHDGWLEPLLGDFDDEWFNRPRQALPEVWMHNGAVDVVRTHVLEDRPGRPGSMCGRRILALPMGAEETADIDTPTDLVLAEQALIRAGLAASAGFTRGEPRHGETT